MAVDNDAFQQEVELSPLSEGPEVAPDEPEPHGGEEEDEVSQPAPRRVASAASASLPKDGHSPVQRARFAPLAEELEDTGGPSNISLLLDVNLRVSVELGRARLPVREVLNLAPGHVVELDKLAGDPVDILANGRLIAKGEVVVVDDQFGVRITEIVSPRQRVEAMH